MLFIHGLGGQLNQFEHLIDCFSHFATILAVDLPGHGRSPYYSDWNVYKHEYLIDLLETVITQNDEQNSEVVIIAHSMGSVLAAKLAARLDARCVGHGLYMSSCSNRYQVRIFKTIFTVHTYFHIQSIQIN